MNSISTTNSFSTFSLTKEMVPTSDSQGGNANVFNIPSSNNSINANEFIAFDINHIQKLPHSSIYSIHTFDGCPSDDDSPINEDVEQYVPFDSGRFLDCAHGAHSSMYMKPPSCSPKCQRYTRNHQQKRLGQHSRWTKPNKLTLIPPLPNNQVHSNYHLVK